MSDIATDATQNAPPQPFRILSLDGGGAKGFYTLGVLREIEGLVKKPLCEAFDLIYGTSTGAIIGSLLALGKSVDAVHELYEEHVVPVMKCRTAGGRTAALASLAATVYRDAKVQCFKTGIGIVATKWDTERPMIFKASAVQAHGRKGTFVPFFGVPIGDAVVSSCSAYPFFKKKVVNTVLGRMELIDGGYCANNPTLYAIADALSGMSRPGSSLRVVSVGVGVYPQPKPALFSKMRLA